MANLSISQLALLIELTEVEIAEMKNIIDSATATDQEQDDAGEHSLQLLALSSVLSEMYREQCAQYADKLSYQELIDDIHQRRL